MANGSIGKNPRLASLQLATRLFITSNLRFYINVYRELVGYLMGNIASFTVVSWQGTEWGLLPSQS